MTKIWKTLLNAEYVIMFMLMLMLRYYFDITGKYRGSAHRNCNIYINPNLGGLFRGFILRVKFPTLSQISLSKTR